MGELYNPFPKLPKNIRQIGEKDDVVKLYVEDYVNTYLKRLYPTGGQDLRVGILLGSVEQHNGTPYIFVDGALEMEEVTVTGERVTFSEAAWKKAYQRIEETFPKRTVQGWFLCGAPGCTLSPLNYWKQHGQYFSGKNQLMYLNGGIDGDESVYITSDDGFYRVRGYSVYYERNQMMQDYMILRKDARRVETGANDRVIRDFRQRMEDRKIEAVSRRGTIRSLGLLCSVLTVAMLASGVVMFNNYQKMKEMETVLVSVLPAGTKGWKALDKEKNNEDIVVEEIKGSVYPTEAGAEEADMSVGVSPEPIALPEEESSSLSTENISEGDADEPLPAESTQSAQNEQTDSTQSAQADKPMDLTANEAFTAPLDEPEQQAHLPASAPVGGSGGNATAVIDYPVTNMKPGDIYIIGEGETLYGICFKLYDDLRYLDDICALNKISDVNKLISGQKLVLPDLSEIQ